MDLTNLPIIGFDPPPILINLSPFSLSSNYRGFKFEAKGLLHDIYFNPKRMYGHSLLEGLMLIN